MADKLSPIEAEKPAKTATAARVAIGKASGFRGLVGYNPVVWREGHCEIELSLAEPHLNSHDIAHGGVTLSLLDAAMGHAATWCAVKGNTRDCVTVSLSTSFLEGPRAGTTVIAIGRLVGVHEKVATCRAELVGSDGRLYATGQASFRYATGSERVEGVPRGGARLLRD